MYDAAGGEYDETYQLLRGKRWRDLPVVEFMHGDTPIPDLSPEAFHYDMPALLIASHDENIDVDLAESLAFYLSPASAKQTDGESPHDDTEGYNHRVSLFTEGQLAVITRVLEEYVARGWETQNEIQQTVEVLRHNTNDR